MPLFSKALMLASEYDRVPIDPRAPELLVAALASVAARERQVVVDSDSTRPPRWAAVTVDARRCTLNLERVDAAWSLNSAVVRAMRFVEAHLAPVTSEADAEKRRFELDVAATNGMLRELDGRSVLLDVETYRWVRARLSRGERPTVDAGAIRPSGAADGSALATPRVSIEATHAPTGQAVGYVRLGGFGPNVSANLERGLAALDAARVKGLVLDLRDNSGGLVDEAIKVADAFIKAGTIGWLVQKERGQERRTELLARNGGHEPEGPLIVLVNKRTASGAELVTAAIKNLGRGIIMGEPTAGAAAIQVVFDIRKGEPQSAPYVPRDPDRDVVQNIIDGKTSAPAEPPPPPVQHDSGDESLGLVLVTGTLLSSSGIPLEPAGLVPDFQIDCAVREPTRGGDDCLLRLAQEAIVRAHDSQRSTLLTAAKAVADASPPPKAAP